MAKLMLMQRPSGLACFHTAHCTLACLHTASLFGSTAASLPNHLEEEEEKDGQGGDAVQDDYNDVCDNDENDVDVWWF